MAKTACVAHTIRTVEKLPVWRLCQAERVALHSLLAWFFRFNSIGQFESSNLFI